MLAYLSDGIPARSMDLDKDDYIIIKSLQLLTLKPILYVCNVEEYSASTGNIYSSKVEDLAKSMEVMS